MNSRRQRDRRRSSRRRLRRRERLFVNDSGGEEEVAPPPAAPAAQISENERTDDSVTAAAQKAVGSLLVRRLVGAVTRGWQRSQAVSALAGIGVWLVAIGMRAACSRRIHGETFT